MLKACRELNLPPEPLGIDITGNLFGKELEYDASLKRPFARDEKPAHSATAELTLEDVGVTEL